MPIIQKEFTQLTINEKIEFFVHCQKLLVEFHPTSPFVFHQGNIQDRIKHIKSFTTYYKGLCYQDENVCALYNKIFISDISEPEQAVKAQMYQLPAENYNAFIIDFVVFKHINDCVEFVKTNYNNKIQYVLYVKNNKVKLFPVINFLSQILNIQSM